ncbi:hypothetical protein EAH87_14785 [Sphingomonas koreensis]|nr:hypothetical protein EAH87_14785 [Sphingomonas koreensis]
MATAPDEPEQESAIDPVRQLRIKRALMVWLIAVFVFFCWQSGNYLGLIDRAGEWQFSRIGSYYPIVTLALFVFLFGAPIVYIFTRRANPDLSVQDNAALRAIRLLRLFVGVAGCFIVAAIAVAVSGALVSARGFPVDVRVGSAAAARPHNGPTRLSGNILFDRTATAGVSIFGHRHEIGFAPVVAAGGAQSDVRFFVASHRPKREAMSATVTGTLRRDALRGDVLQLFRNVGFRVSDPYYVLYTDIGDARRSYFLTAVQLGAIALIAALAALYQRRRVRLAGRRRRSGTPHVVG